jgi:hypothetical protein
MRSGGNAWSMTRKCVSIVFNGYGEELLKGRCFSVISDYRSRQRISLADEIGLALIDVGPEPVEHVHVRRCTTLASLNMAPQPSHPPRATG